MIIGDNRHAFADELAKNSHLNELFSALQDPENQNWQRTEREILLEWSKSGSRAMDLLLARGIKSMTEGDLPAAIDHFSALIDHAPEFAEGWNKRATVFFMMEEYGLSVADIERTLALNPNHFGAMAGLGSILEKVGRKSDAIAAYNQALEIHPRLENLKETVKRLEQDTQGTSL